MLFWFAFSTKYIYVHHWDIICEPNDQFTHLEVELAKFYVCELVAGMIHEKFNFGVFFATIIKDCRWFMTQLPRYKIWHFAERLIEQLC